jgi:hypothetical protein
LPQLRGHCQRASEMPQVREAQLEHVELVALGSALNPGGLADRG